MTNLHQMYCVPKIVPAVQPDDPLSGAVPSDHRTPIAIPINATDTNPRKVYTSKVARPLQLFVTNFKLSIRTDQGYTKGAKKERQCEIAGSIVRRRAEDGAAHLTKTYKHATQRLILTHTHTHTQAAQPGDPVLRAQA